MNPRGSSSGNPALTDVSALNGLEEVSSDVVIMDDTALTDADAQDLVDEIDFIGGTVLILGNG